MADSVLTEVNYRPRKIPKLQKACEETKSSSKQRELRYGEGEDDEYLRQYLLFHYQLEKTHRPLDQTPPISETQSNAELIREVTLFAIEKHNEAKGTKLVFVEHVEANYRFANGLLYWLTFLVRDVSSSSSPESKIYQAKVWRRGKQFKIPIFRLKPTDEEIDSVEVQPPSPMRYDFDKPPIVFARAGSEDGLARTGAGLARDSFHSSCWP